MNRAPRYAIITGGASGLGRALALRLARDGWHLAIADINDEGSQQTLDMVRAAGGSGQVEHLDVTSHEQWLALVERLRGQWPQLDLLANNAGVSAAGEVGTAPIDDWHWLININVFGVVNGCHSCISWLKQNPAGAHIINTASMAALAALPTMAIYNAAKSAVIALSETLYVELFKYNIGVTVLCPSFFQTDLLRTARMENPDEFEVAKKSMERAPFKADDLAKAAVRAIRRKRLYVVMPFKARLVWRIKRMIPTLFAWYIAEWYKRNHLPESL